MGRSSPHRLSIPSSGCSAATTSGDRLRRERLSAPGSEDLPGATLSPYKVILRPADGVRSASRFRHRCPARDRRRDLGPPGTTRTGDALIAESDAPSIPPDDRVSQSAPIGKVGDLVTTGRSSPRSMYPGKPLGRRSHPVAARMRAAVTSTSQLNASPRGPPPFSPCSRPWLPGPRPHAGIEVEQEAQDDEHLPPAPRWSMGMTSTPTRPGELRYAIAMSRRGRHQDVLFHPGNAPVFDATARSPCRAAVRRVTTFTVLADDADDRRLAGRRVL